MSRLMEGCDLLFLIRDDAALFLRPDAHLDKGLPDILLGNVGTVRASGKDRRLVQQVFQVRAGKARGGLGHLLQIHILRQRLVPGVQLQDILPSAHIRRAHRDLSVKASGAQDGRIQDIHPVRGRQHDDALVHAEAVHLHQQLVQGLFPFVMAAPHARPAAPGHGIDLVDEHDAGRILFRVLKQVAHAGSSHAHEHLHEIGAGNAEEGHVRLAGDGLCEQGLSRSGRSLQQNALGDPRSHLRIFGGLSQEIDDLLQILLFLLQARHILQGDPVVLSGAHPGAALAKVHHLVPAGSRPRVLGVHHHEEKDHDHRRHHQHRKHVIHEPAFLRHIPHQRIDLILLEQRDRVLHIRHIGRPAASVRKRHGNGARRRLWVLADHRAGHQPSLQILPQSPFRIIILYLIQGAGPYHDQERSQQQNENQVYASAVPNQFSPPVLPPKAAFLLSKPQPSNSTTPM